MINANKEELEPPQELKHEPFEKINKYEKDDMSPFLKEYLNWKNTPTQRSQNCYSIRSDKDITFINNVMSTHLKYIRWFCTQYKIDMPIIKSTSLPTRRLGYLKNDEICTFSFTPFTPTGKIKKVNYVIDIKTFPGDPKFDLSKMNAEEMMSYVYNDPSDGYPYAKIELNKNFEVIRATYQIWEKAESTTYKIGKENGVYKMKKLTLQTMENARLGKPARVLVKDDILVNSKTN